MRRFLLAAAGLLLLLTAPGAHAATPAQIARQLERSPLYVDPSLRGAVPDAQRRAVLAAIRRAPEPVFVALIPLTAGDRYGGDERRFLDVLHGRLGRDGIYVTVGQVLTARGYGVEVQDDRLSQATTVGNFESDEFDEPSIDKVRRFAEVLFSDTLGARYAATEKRLEARRDAPAREASDEGGDGGGSGGLVAGIAGLVVLVGLLALATVLLLRRRRHAHPAPETRPVIPARVFEHARTAEADDLREEIEHRLLAFADRVKDEAVPDGDAAQRRQQHALDAYAAARRVLQSSPGMVDLVGALVLVEDGGRALAASEALAAGRRVPATAPLCFFDPRHAGTTKPVHWEPHSARSGLQIAACPDCAAALRANRPPAVLLDDGRPWFEADTLWARTGFGTFEPDLAQRVLRGELRRRDGSRPRTGANWQHPSP